MPKFDLNKIDLSVKVTVVIPPNQKESTFESGIVIGYDLESSNLISLTPDQNGYLFIFSGDSKINHNNLTTTLKKCGQMKHFQSFYHIEDKFKQLKKVINTGSFNMKLEKIGALFIGYINDIKIFEHFDESEIYNIKFNNIGFFSNNKIGFKNLEVKTKPSTLQIYKIPSPYIDLIFKNREHIIYESCMNIINFMGSPTPSLYLKDVTHSRSLNDKLQNKMKEINSDLEMAKKFQSSLATIKLKDNSGFKYTSAYIPAGEVSGDMIDIIDLGNNKFGVIIFDVSGHGIASSLVCGIAKNIIRNAFASLKDLSEITSEINNALVNTAVSQMFITAFISIIDLNSRKIEFIRAGHPHQYLLIPKNKESLTLNNPNAIIGIIEDYKYTASTIDIPKGSKLFLFTDGIIEARSPTGEFYSKTRLQENITKYKDRSIEELKDCIISDIVEFSELSIKKQEDDITILILGF